jgi:hypothetical protein
MRFFIQSILVLFAGLFLGASMMGYKSGRGFYGFSINSRIVPPGAARHYWNEAIGQKKPELMDLQERFHQDLQRIQWTWDRELSWKKAPAKSGPASSPPPPLPITVP